MLEYFALNYRLARAALPILLFAAAALVVVPSALASGQVEIRDFGFYDLSVDGSVPAPEDISGSRNIVSNIRLQRQTQEIDAQLGRSFGFRFRNEISTEIGYTNYFGGGKNNLLSDRDFVDASVKYAF